jgi:hypothetical protein
MAELRNLDRFHAEVRSKLEPYVTDLVDLLTENLRSVVVYGSAAGPDYVPKKSNVNLLLVCGELRLETLKRTLKTVKKGRKKGIVAPLFLTVEHMNTSSDVFPIEFLNMKDVHVVVYGEDVLDRIEIGFENLRLECEEQLKGMLIRLRQAYLEVGTDAKALRGVLLEAVTSLVPVLRGVLRLLGEETPRAKDETVQSLSSRLGVGTDSIQSALGMKLEGEKVPGGDLESLFGRYLDEVEGIALAVDKLVREGSTE